MLEGRSPTCHVAIPGLGDVLFCHATPRNDTEIFTRLTPDDRLLPIFEGLVVSVVVCGHTHMQFDRMVGTTRVVNAGSVVMPFGEPRADWHGDNLAAFVLGFLAHVFFFAIGRGWIAAKL